jgi:hypothetical protein
MQDRDARLILSKDLLVSKTSSAYLLSQQQAAVKIVPGAVYIQRSRCFKKNRHEA